MKNFDFIKPVALIVIIATVLTITTCSHKTETANDLAADTANVASSEINSAIAEEECKNATQPTMAMQQMIRERDSIETVRKKEEEEKRNTPSIIKNAVTDIDGNTYNAVKIGQQIWMSENLRTTHYADGTYIKQGSSSSVSTAYWYYPSNKSSTMQNYGLLYNWSAVMNGEASSNRKPSGVQGICPDGWHVPSDAEWTQLTNYVGSQNQYCCSNNSANIAKALASKTGWKDSPYTCTVGNVSSFNNTTGFSALPAGGYYWGMLTSLSTSFSNFAYFWSATATDRSGAYYRGLDHEEANVSKGNNYRADGFSVRCVKD